MLIQFSVGNFKTFKDKVTLSMIASNYDKETREEENVISNSKYNLRNLKSAVIYGANASGKSKFMEALMFMRHFTINSSKDSQKGDDISIEPFRLNTDSIDSPSEFEVVFLYDNIQYRYGFEVDKEQIVSEWLYQKAKTKEVEIFYRDYQDFELHQRNFKKGTIAVKEGLIRDNALLLSLAAQLNDEISINVINWFKSLKTISGLREEGYQGYTMSRTKDPKTKVRILELLKAADLGIQDIKLELLDIEKLPKDLPKELRDRLIKESKEENSDIVSDVLTSHKKFDSTNKYIEDVHFSMDDDESSGTRKFFALTGPILDVIENGYILVVDELDSKLHPNLVCKLVSLFNSKELNPKNAQLIFNTHDTNLLGSGLFRRDQIWFAEKNKFGAANIYSLADFKTDSVRKTEAFEENYIRGKYGSVPYLGLFDSLTLKKLLLQDENEE
ncbi:AAA family ATPase [Sunxiuqinia sp. sy24]|uniref:AAA family ATPase n=1 Tax=Sunxiuqinia sp. sy24 TaxID=3461495 RepID=UPI004046523D